MQYICLRDCYVNDRYFTKGKVFDLPDGFPKYEKNFKLVEGQVEPESAPEPEVASPPEKLVEDAPETQREPKPGEYLCTYCKTIHRASSKLGQKHLKYKQEA